MIRSMARASSAFTSHSSAARSSSAAKILSFGPTVVTVFSNDLPARIRRRMVLCMIVLQRFHSRMAVLVMLSRPFQPVVDQIDVPPRRLGVASRLFLEDVQNVHGRGESDRIDGTIRVAVEIVDQLHNARSAKPFEWLCRTWRFAVLRIQQIPSKGTSHLLRQASQIPEAGADEVNRFSDCDRDHWESIVDLL